MKVSFLGTGLMGRPMAERLLRAGYDLYVYNRTISKTEPLKEKGASVIANPREAIDLAEVNILMLADGKAVKNSLFKKSGENSFKGHTVIQMSTISPAESREIAERIIQSGGEYLEAPVLGSTPQAQEGKLIIMAGGSKELFEKWRPLLEFMGCDIFYAGETGKASALKLALNQLIASLTASFSLSLGIVQREEINVDVFMNILRKSVLFAPTFERKLPFMLSDNFSQVNFSARHLLKDVALISDEAKSLGLDTVVLDGVRKLLKNTIRDGYADEDYSVIYRAVNMKSPAAAAEIANDEKQLPTASITEVSNVPAENNRDEEIRTERRGIQDDVNAGSVNSTEAGKNNPQADKQDAEERQQSDSSSLSDKQPLAE